MAPHSFRSDYPIDCTATSCSASNTGSASTSAVATAYHHGAADNGPPPCKEEPREANDNPYGHPPRRHKQTAKWHHGGKRPERARVKKFKQFLRRQGKVVYNGRARP